MSPNPEFKIYTRAEVEAMSESEKVELILRLQEVVLHLVGVCEALRGQNETLVLRCEQLERRVKKLEERLNQNRRVHDQRGREAMDAQGVLPQFQGRLIHDCWGPYFQYDCLHGLCNAHLLRELKFAHEEQGQAWAFELYTLLEILCGLKTARAGAPFSAEALAS